MAPSYSYLLTEFALRVTSYCRLQPAAAKPRYFPWGRNEFNVRTNLLPLWGPRKGRTREAVSSSGSSMSQNLSCIYKL